MGIQVGQDGTVWGVTKDDDIFTRAGVNGSWVHIAGKLHWVSAQISKNQSSATSASSKAVEPTPNANPAKPGQNTMSLGGDNSLERNTDAKRKMRKGRKARR